MTPNKRIIQEYASNNDTRRLAKGRCVLNTPDCAKCEYILKCVLTFKFSGKMDSGWSKQEEKESKKKYQSIL